MNGQVTTTKPRSCYKCGYFADTAEAKCPQCGRILHTVIATRIRGLLMMLCGVFLMAIIGYISIWMLDVIYNPGPSKAQFTGTQEEKLGIFALFAGIIVFGAIRDREAIGALPLGVKALGSNPRKSAKDGVGEVDVPVEIAGVAFRPGAHVWADADGILVER